MKHCFICNSSELLHGIETTWGNCSIVLQRVEDCDKIICENCIMRIGETIYPHVSYWWQQRLEKWKQEQKKKLNSVS